MNRVGEEQAEDLMVKGFAEMYMDSSKFGDFVELQDIRNYPGGEWVRDPMDSYEYFVNSHPDLGLMVRKSIDANDDPLVFASYEGNGIINVSEEGQMPLIKVLAKAAVDKMDYWKKKSAKDILGSEDLLEEGMERAIYKSLDPQLKNALYQDFYKFQTTELSDAQVEQLSEIL